MSRVARDLLDLPFDFYDRYRLAANILREISANVVLDIGGSSSPLHLMVPAATIVAVDITSPLTDQLRPESFIVADGSKLPFRDESFDFVVAMDTLEHIPPSTRSDFLRSLASVSRLGVMLTFPSATDEVEFAETVVIDYCQTLYGPDHPTVKILEEHRRFGLPSLAETEEVLKSVGMSTGTIFIGEVETWLSMMLAGNEFVSKGWLTETHLMNRSQNRLPMKRLTEKSKSYRTALLAVKHSRFPMEIFQKLNIECLDGDSKISSSVTHVLQTSLLGAHVQVQTKSLEDGLSLLHGQTSEVSRDLQHLSDLSQQLKTDSSSHEEALRKLADTLADLGTRIENIESFVNRIRQTILFKAARRLRRHLNPLGRQRGTNGIR